jgi:hypothetical protein
MKISLRVRSTCCTRLEPAAKLGTRVGIPDRACFCTRFYAPARINPFQMTLSSAPSVAHGMIVMYVKRHWPSCLAPSCLGFASLAFFLSGAAAALAEACFPHCDYTHYYGPFDFSYRQPGLFGYPQQCGPQGDCSPHLAYTTGILQKPLMVRFPRVTTAPPQQP